MWLSKRLLHLISRQSWDCTQRILYNEVSKRSRTYPEKGLQLILVYATIIEFPYPSPEIAHDEWPDWKKASPKSWRAFGHAESWVRGRWACPVFTPILAHCRKEPRSENRSDVSPDVHSSLTQKTNSDRWTCRILPIMVVAYMMAFIDKQTLSYTSLMGLIQDLHLTGNQYSWSSGIFYFGYLFFS